MLRPDWSVPKTWNDDFWGPENDADCTHPPASTALHYASLLGDLKAVELLLKSGADSTVVDDYGQLAVSYAALSMNEKRLEQFKRLCDEHNSKPTKKDEEASKGQPEEESTRQRPRKLPTTSCTNTLVNYSEFSISGITRSARRGVDSQTPS